MHGENMWLVARPDMEIDGVTQMKFDSMQRYGKHGWAKMNMEQIDVELRLHWDNMSGTVHKDEYLARHADRIEYLLDIYQHHARDWAETKEQQV